MEAGLSQTDLAEAIERPQSHVSKLESGERRLDFLELVDLCTAYGIEVTDFASRFEALISR